MQVWYLRDKDHEDEMYALLMGSIYKVCPVGMMESSNRESELLCELHSKSGGTLRSDRNVRTDANHAISIDSLVTVVLNLLNINSEIVMVQRKTYFDASTEDINPLTSERLFAKTILFSFN